MTRIADLARWSAAVAMLFSVAAISHADDNSGTSIYAPSSSSWNNNGSNSSTAVNRPAKVQWKPYRPQRSDASTASGDTGETTSANSNFKTDVFDDSTPPRSTIKLTASADKVNNSTVDQDEFLNSALKDPFFDESAAAKTRRPAASTANTPENLSAPLREAPPPLRIDADAAQRLPPELTPTDPIRSASAHRTPTSQIEPGTPIVPQQPDLLPNDNQSGQAPRKPEEDCREKYSDLKALTINKLSIDIKVTGEPGSDIPYECSLTSEPFTPRCWQLTTYTWKASALCHKPLYFEDEALERYGHSHGPVCEYLASSAHFFGDLVLLPYHMGVETPCECIYDLGVYRVGDCAPYMLDPFPFSWRGVVTGAIGYCGVAALLP